jgi:hypothetical protein
MAKKISVCFRDDFLPGDFAKLTSLVVRTLRADFPGFIVHTEAAKNFRALFIVYVYGIWGGADTQSVVDAADKTVARLVLDFSLQQARGLSLLAEQLSPGTVE